MLLNIDDTYIRTEHIDAIRPICSDEYDEYFSFSIYLRGSEISFDNRNKSTLIQIRNTIINATQTGI